MNREEEEDKEEGGGGQAREECQSGVGVLGRSHCGLMMGREKEGHRWRGGGGSSRAPSSATATLCLLSAVRLFKSFHNNNNINNNKDHDNAKKIYINPSHVSQL